jgi:hypothetical protein
MGDLLDPKPAQWQRKVPLEDIPEDRVLLLANRLKAVIDSEVEPTIVQLAGLRLVLKAIIGNYRAIVGHETAKEMMRQASQLTEQYEVKGIDDRPEDE